MKSNNEEIFVQGGIPSSYLSEVLDGAKKSTQMGAHNIFLGQVRNDRIQSKEVTSLLYSANTQLAMTEYDKILTELHTLYTLENVLVKHSIGSVNVSEICLFIFISSAHRTECQSAMNWLIEAVKKRLPIFAKEILSDEEYVWKVNKY